MTLPNVAAFADKFEDTVNVTVSLTSRQRDYLRRLAEAAVFESGQDIELWRALRALYSAGPIAADLGLILKEPPTQEATQ